MTLPWPWRSIFPCPPQPELSRPHPATQRWLWGEVVWGRKGNTLERCCGIPCWTLGQEKETPMGVFMVYNAVRWGTGRPTEGGKTRGSNNGFSWYTLTGCHGKEGEAALGLMYHKEYTNVYQLLLKRLTRMLISICFYF